MAAAGPAWRRPESGTRTVPWKRKERRLKETKEGYAPYAEASCGSVCALMWSRPLTLYRKGRWASKVEKAGWEVRGERRERLEYEVRLSGMISLLTFFRYCTASGGVRGVLGRLRLLPDDDQLHVLAISHALAHVLVLEHGSVAVHVLLGADCFEDVVVHSALPAAGRCVAAAPLACESVDAFVHAVLYHAHRAILVADGQC